MERKYVSLNKLSIFLDNLKEWIDSDFQKKKNKILVVQKTKRWRFRRKTFRNDDIINRHAEVFLLSIYSANSSPFFKEKGRG